MERRVWYFNASNLIVFDRISISFINLVAFFVKIGLTLAQSIGTLLSGPVKRPSLKKNCTILLFKQYKTVKRDGDNYTASKHQTYGCRLDYHIHTFVVVLYLYIVVYFIPIETYNIVRMYQILRTKIFTSYCSNLFQLWK